MTTDIVIGGKSIGKFRPTFVVAELSANHNQDFEEAVRLIRAAKDAGADAIKIQTYTPDTITLKSDRECFRVSAGTIWDGRTLHDIYREAYTPWEWQPKLRKLALELGMELFSSPFDPTAIDFLEKMDVPAYKIASFELVDLPLIRKAAKTGKPLIMSTGMASLEEIQEALQTARDAGNSKVILLKCTSAYPAPPEDMNLRTIPDLARVTGAPVGLSDHTLGISVPVAAIAVGACMVEKHFTISRNVPGPDSAFSLEPHEFKAMVDAIRIAEKALGEVHYGVSAKDAESRKYRRSLFIVKNMKAGDLFTEENVRSIRPAAGLHPRHLHDVLGKMILHDAEMGTPLSWELVRR